MRLKQSLFKPYADPKACRRNEILRWELKSWDYGLDNGTGVGCVRSMLY